MVAATMLKVMTLTLLTTLCGVHGVDLTLNLGASGADVVTSVCERIRSKCVFSEDRLFLRRTAYVMSGDGNDSFTYRPGFDGGIWQITRSMFLATSSCSHPSILHACRNITSELGINWSRVQWSDLRKPLYSGLAAALSALFTLGAKQMHGNITQQAILWATMYGQANGGKFLQTAVNTPQPHCEDKLDLAFVLDSSSSISFGDFHLMKIFTASVVDVLDVSHNAIRIANIIYASTVNVNFDFDDYSSKASVKSSLLSAAKIGGGTNTADALDQAIALYNSSRYGARTDAKRVTVLVTDGMSNSLSATTTAAENLKNSNVTVFAVGVGSYNLPELQAVASHPVCSHVLTLTDFQQIHSIIDEIQQSACKASHIGDVTNSIAVHVTIETVVPPPDKPLKATVSCGTLHIYVSVTELTPSEAVYDQLYIATPQSPVELTFVETLPEGQRVYITVKGTPMPHTGSNGCTNYRWSLLPARKHTRARLVGGTTPREGRLELSVDDQTWGTVCDDGFTTENAAVVCNMLGIPSTHPQYYAVALYGPGIHSQPILLDEVRCTGTESSLLDCQHNAIGTNDCSHGEDVSVVCGSVSGMKARLVGGTTPMEGRLEVSMDGQTWGTVCDDGFTNENAAVVCKMLGIPSTHPQFHSDAFDGLGSNWQHILLDEVNCAGIESSLLDCLHNPIGTNDCSHDEDVGVVCDGGGAKFRARLVNGNSTSNGRLEIQMNNGKWSTVCDDSFGKPEAVVACRMLGFNGPEPAAVSSNVYGAGSGNIILDDLQCTGTELSLSECGNNGFYQHNCQHSKDVGLQCTTSV